MTAKKLFLERTCGYFNRGRDRWYLISNQDGTFSVEHAWMRPAPTADGFDDTGTSVVGAPRFFACAKDELLLTALRAAIAFEVTGDIRLQLATLDLASEHPRVFDPLSTVVEWLSVCRNRDLDRLMTFYDPASTLDCVCSGRKLCNGQDELRVYWQRRLTEPSAKAYSLQDIWQTLEATVLDYISHNGEPVRAFFYFDSNGLVKHTKCGPIKLAKAG